MLDSFGVPEPAPPPDELSYVDPDVRAHFADRSYLMGLPTLAQLVKELQLLRADVVALTVAVRAGKVTA